MSYLREIDRWLSGRRWALALAVAAAAVRLAYLATVVRDPFFGYLRHIPDSFYFNSWAQEMVSRGAWLGGKDVFFIGPLYAYFLAVIYALIGPHLAVVRLVHVALDAGTTVFIFGLARRAVGERPARVAGFLWVFFLPEIFKASFILPVSLDLFLVAGGLYYLARCAEGRWGNALGAGLMLGLAALDRTNLLVFVVGAFPVFVIYRKLLGWRKPAVFVAAFAAVVGLATVRNGLVAGDWVFVSSQGGVNFYLGNSERATGVYWNLGQMGQGRPQELNRDLARALAEKATGHKMKASEVSRWWFGEGFKWMRDNPGWAARLYWDKFRLVTNDYEVALNVDFYFMKFISPFHLVPLPYFGFLFAFGVVGLVFGWRGSSFARTLGAVFVVSYLASVMAFFISSRYRLPVVPALVVFAGAGLVAVYDAWRAWRWRRAAVLTALAAAAGTFSLWPPLDIERGGAFGQSFYRYGKFYLDEGDDARAVTYLHKAITLSPEIAEAYILLGVVYDRLGQHDTALETFYRGVLVAPGIAEVNYNYGVALARNGRLAEGRLFIARAASLNPQYVDAWLQLAELSIALRDYGRAEVALRRAAELVPADARVQMRLAEILMETGRERDALDRAQRVLEIDPAQPGANYLVGVWFYRRGDYDAAVPYLEKEKLADPGNARADGFLAMTHMRRGDVARARAAYRAYLDLGGEPDPVFEKDAGMSGE